MLAAYACDPALSRGRRIDEPPSPPRNDHQRDRDRIVHSTAFRRLVYKTQVFINHEGDLYRTRLTHTLEVAQLGRSIARALALNEDLVEAIALAHDLGHTPFGHAGQDALGACMRGRGGFEHNLQSLRVVDRLEQRYPSFDGLNLTFETREGILKHCAPRIARHMETVERSGVAHRFLVGEQASLEAQLVNLVDELTYAIHDIDDGVRSGLLVLDQLEAVPLFARHLRATVSDYPSLANGSERRLLSEVLRRMLSAQVHDVCKTTSAGLAAHPSLDALAVRRIPAVVAFSVEMRKDVTTLRRFLFEALYRHPKVAATSARAREVVQALFGVFTGSPRELPAEHRGLHDEIGVRAVADYIAGMTDRFAAREYERVTGQSAFEL
jgi:dGTPase